MRKGNLSKMHLEPTTEITLYELLKQREHSFVQIHEYESRINKILGQSYPFFSKPVLPSTSKKKRRTTKKVKQKKRTIRRLKPETEDAYLVNYEYCGEQREEVLREYRLIQLLVKNDIPNIILYKISTIFFNGNEEYDVIEELIK